MDELKEELKEYTRPALPPEKQKMYEQKIMRLIAPASRKDLIDLIKQLAAENYILTQECNEHRRARGFAEYTEH